MKSLKLFALLVSYLAINSWANAQTAPKWEMDKSHSSVRFEINHFFSTVPGKFTDFDGEFYFNPNDPTDSKFNFTIQIASVDTDDKTRDEDLKSESFFEMAKWPTMKFTSTKVLKKGKDKYVITGKLTIKDKTQTVDLPLKITGIMDNPWNDEKVIMGIEIETSIDRTDYGVGTGNWAATAVVSDEVKIKVAMELDGIKSSL